MIIFGIVTLVVVIAHFYLLGSSQIDFLKKNWVEYRCNPIYMPLAGFVGQDVIKNFYSCNLKGFQDYTGFIMDPLMSDLGTITDSVEEISDSMDSMRGMVSDVRTGFTGILGTVFGKIHNVMAETQYIVIRMRTLMMRIMGVLMSFVYVFYGGMETGQAVIDGPIGKTVKML
jgi:hypothetical protein